MPDSADSAVENKQGKEMLYMVFDVESIGLHGEGFAVGYVVVDRNGERLDSGLYACDPSRARGTRDSHNWISENGNSIDATHISPAGVRALFWHTWLEWKDKGATLWADCAWPVEARFLIECIEDDHGMREWAGPYPLHDIATLQFAAGLDPLAFSDRREDELPKHNPFKDALQSARIMLECMAQLEKQGTRR